MLQVPICSLMLMSAPKILDRVQHLPFRNPRDFFGDIMVNIVNQLENLAAAEEWSPLCLGPTIVHGIKNRRRSSMWAGMR